jgi:cytoskeletal protein RodZ
MDMKRILALLTIALLLVVLGILASCEAFDAVTGDITKPADPVAATQPAVVPPAVAAVQAIADQTQDAVVSLTAEVARVRADAAAKPGAEDVAAKLAKAEEKLVQTTEEAAKWRAVVDRVLVGATKPAETPAEKVRNATDPILPFLPQPVGAYATIAAGLLGWVLTLIQKQRTAAAKAESKANMATAENLVTSLEAMKVAGLSMTTDEGRAVLSTVQTPETQALVRKLTTKVTN